MAIIIFHTDRLYKIIYTNPPPNIRRNIPNSIDITQKMIPTTEALLLSIFDPLNAIILIIRPINENGILNQFNDPKQGNKPTIVPISASIPQIRLIVCIGYLLFVF